MRGSGRITGAQPFLRELLRIIPLRMLTHKADILNVDASRAKLQGISFAPKGYLIILGYLDELSYCTYCPTGDVSG